MLVAPYSNSLPRRAHEPALLVEEDEDYSFDEQNFLEQCRVSRGPYENNDDELGSSDEDSDNESEEDEEEFNFKNDYSDETDDIILVYSDDEKEDHKKIEPEVPTPFWFGNEDQEQLKVVNKRYYDELKLGEEKKRQIREPESFVGRVKRVKVHDGNNFSTFDTVEIYRNSTLPPSSVMPILRTVYLLTTWSLTEGIPIKFIHLNQTQQIEWGEKTVSDAKPSSILCLPAYGTLKYDYFVSDSRTEVTHSPSSLNTVEQRIWFEKYIPKHLRYQQDEDGSEFPSPRQIFTEKATDS